ncbi:MULTISPECIES: ergothioneine biosynthesis protein EgtC [unclassified Crossiella]|uniref:ergothioneine biosynthesis protein EgtC n=1 Tax=unclassified Crossiella TaxID=2620835 RepID=UPI001FFE6D7A|nr:MULTISPECIES: ergothioneine biosynthesis protein EgtC [unclassified Crossiella]MCK2242072.1 ergothioneine biosynthesis protein EgtC [Crossiella sp. S99.2]MCK2255975.1 ergothioneine biosynthesis protein EgtC [Crossiella sp. S99.1]
MCRHLAYLGPAMPLADLVLTPPHSLLRQSWAPADMRGGGTINADGHGVGWYPQPGAAPVRHRSASPLWTDTSFASWAGAVSSGAVLAAVRSATVGMPVTESANAPFLDGQWLFSHNGKVTGWPHSLAALAETLPATDLLTLDAATDSALLWALLRRRLRAGEPAATAVSDLVRTVAAAAPDSRLNLLLTDGTNIVATTWWHSLSVLHTGKSVIVASEPTDERDWQPVPDRHLVLANSSTLDIISLEDHR